jgi:hypothetical protein
MLYTETYYRRVMGEEKTGGGLGIKWEGNLIYQRIYNADATNSRFIPVLFEYSKVEHIPTPLQGVTRHRIDTRWLRKPVSSNHQPAACHSPSKFAMVRGNFWMH